MVESYVNFWKNYAVFSGRSRRRDYWVPMLVNYVIYFILYLIGFGSMFADLAAGNMPAFGFFGWIAMLFALAMFIPSLAVAWRRLHDIGKSGGWFFIACVPVVGQIWALILYCTDSAPDNEYGSNPKA